MSESGTRLIVGLGNPGREYEKTRHNIGFMSLDALSESYKIPVFKTKFGALFGKGDIKGFDVILIKPQSYMNRSGIPVMSLANYFRAASGDMIVIHDDIDLAFGKIKIKEKGGDGGHKGIRSIIDAFGGDEFVRIRLGVGRPSEGGKKVADYVLDDFSKEEGQSLEKIINASLDAVVTTLRFGSKTGMNHFNNKMFTDL